MLIYLTVALAILVLILANACRTLLIAEKDTAIRDCVFSLDKELQDARKLLHEQDIVLSRVGELFDHAGVDLEHTEHKRASEDLKKLGSILRSRGHHAESPFTLSWAQQTLTELGNRYGVESTGGGQYDIGKAVRIGEEIFESVLAKHTT